MPSNCPCCSDPISSQAQDVFKCDGCKARTHISCVGLSADEATRLTRSKAKSVAVKTFCTPCANSIDKFSKLTDLITNLQTNLDSKISELVNKVSELEKSNSISDLKPDLYESIVNETMDRISRSKNIVIFNAPEATDPRQQETNDISLVNDIIEVLEIPGSVSPVSVTRFGKPSRNKPRILKASFGSPEEARRILRNKKRLANTRLSTISIQDDKTVKQQGYLKAVRTELRRRMDEENENDLTIKYIQGIPTIVSSKN